MGTRTRVQLSNHKIFKPLDFEVFSPKRNLVGLCTKINTLYIPKNKNMNEMNKNRPKNNSDSEKQEHVSLSRRHILT